MKIGIIGERNNNISYSMLYRSLECKNVQIVWFIEAKIQNTTEEKLYGRVFDYGIAMRLLQKTYNILASRDGRGLDCKRLCIERNILYIVPNNLSINNGLPDEMYLNPDADYALIAGCDQILNENGLKIAKHKILNYHYSPLPAYRGKHVVFWQWYNKEPYIGYSFHEVTKAIDTGDIIYQGKVNYAFNESLPKVSLRVIEESSEQICKVYECLDNGSSVCMKEPLRMSYYPAKKFLELCTLDSSKRIAEVIDIFNRTGIIILPNGIKVTKIINFSHLKISKYQICRQGIKVPLSDGHIIGSISRRIPFSILRILIGKKKLLSGLN